MQMAGQKRTTWLDWLLMVLPVAGYFVFAYWAASTATWVTQPIVALVWLIVIGVGIGLWTLWDDIKERRWLEKTYGADVVGYQSELLVSPGTIVVFLAGIGINLEWLTSHNIENVVCEWVIALVVIVLLHFHLYGDRNCPQPWRGLTAICGLLVATAGVSLGLQPILWGWHLFITISGIMLLGIGFLAYAND